MPAIQQARTGYLNGTTDGWSARSLFYLNNAWWLVALDTANTKIRVYKSLDGSSWGEQDTANALSHTGNTHSYNAGVPLSGTNASKIHVAYRTATNTIRVRRFDTSTGLWESTDVGSANATTVARETHNVVIGIRSDNDVIVGYRSSITNDFYYVRYEGSSWSAAQTIYTTNTSVPLDLVMTANSDMCHFFWYVQTANDLICRSLDGANALGTTTTIDATVSTVVQWAGFGGYVNDAGTHRISFLSWDSTGEYDFVYSTSSSAPTFTTVASMSPTTVSDPGSMGGAIAVFDNKYFC